MLYPFIKVHTIVGASGFGVSIIYVTCELASQVNLTQVLLN